VGATLARDPVALLESRRKEPGKDIWLFGGGSLFRSLLDSGLIDTVEVGLVMQALGTSRTSPEDLATIEELLDRTSGGTK
jgi:dihydrofolate reductase